MYQDLKADSSASANENLGNIRTVKAFSGESIGVNTFNISTNGVFNIGKNMAIYYAVMMTIF